MKKVAYKLFVLLTTIVCLILSACGTPSEPSATPAALSKPQNLRVEGKLLVWEEVENATGYVVKIKEEENQTKECTYDLSNLPTSATYLVAVKALGGGTYTDSEWSSVSYRSEEVVESGYDSKGFLYTLLYDGTGYEVSAGNATTSSKTLVIPDYFKGLPVKAIADYGFAHYEEKRTPLPSGGGFIYEVEDCNPYAEEFCNKVTTTLQLPSRLETIGEKAFACMIKLKEIVIPDSVMEIKNSAFWGCKSLKRVTLPKTLKEIPAGCFSFCGLEEISFPNTLKSIGRRAFRGAIDDFGNYMGPTFSEISFPASIVKIDSTAFDGCLYKDSLVIPDL